MSVVSAVPRAVLLDLDDTLYPCDPCHASASDAVTREFEAISGIPPIEIAKRLQDAKITVKSRLEKTAASHSRLLYFKKTLELLGLGADFEAALRLEDLYWSTFLGKMIPFKGAVEFLQRLKQLGIPTVIVTDLTAQIQLRKVIRLGMSGLVDGVITSEEVGSEKPDPRPFNTALEVLRVDSKNTWMIGDNPEKDIAGANALPGMLSIQKVKNPGDSVNQETRTDLEFTEFSELLDLLEHLAGPNGEVE